MKKQVFESPIGESYIMAELPNGLKIYVMEKPQHTSSFAIFGTKYGSVDTCFSKDGGESVCVPEGIAHFLEHKLFESEQLDAFEQFAKTGAYSNAYTSFDRTCYLFSSSDLFDENLDSVVQPEQVRYDEDNIRKFSIRNTDKKKPSVYVINGQKVVKSE